jgi:hypothetical protein
LPRFGFPEMRLIVRKYKQLKLDPIVEKNQRIIDNSLKKEALEKEKLKQLQADLAKLIPAGGAGAGVPLVSDPNASKLEADIEASKKRIMWSPAARSTLGLAISQHQRELAVCQEWSQDIRDQRSQQNEKVNLMQQVLNTLDDDIGEKEVIVVRKHTHAHIRQSK